MVNATAQTLFNFEGGDLPSGTALYGFARLADDGSGENICLHLTDPSNTHGQFLVSNMGNGKGVRAINIHWKSLIGGGASGGADGYSLNWATDLPESPDYALPGEEGIGSGLTVTVDTWDNGDNEAPGIELRWKSNLVAFASIPKDDPGGGLPYLRRNQFVDAQVIVDTKGMATFTYDGVAITAQLDGWKGIKGGDILFGARTGGATDRHWIDDLHITTGIFTAGVFSGLFYKNDEFDHDRRGFVNLKLTARGAFSGYLLLAGTRYPISGAFDLETLHATVHVPRPGTTTLSVELTLDDQDSITGVVNASTWVAGLRADRQIWNKKLNPALTHVGKYTAIIERGTGSFEPGGNGFGTVAVDAAGMARFAGSLGDGAKVTQRVAVSAKGYMPFYVSTHKGQGSMLAWVPLNNAGDGSARTTWTRKPGAPGLLYPAGFSFRPEMTVSPYTPPARGAKILDILEGFAAFEGGNLEMNFVAHFGLTQDNKILNLDATGLTLKFVGKTGLFSGTVKRPGTNTKMKFAGVVARDRVFAAGQFIGPTESGSVIIGGPN
jgi:hypothetical protein